MGARIALTGATGLVGGHVLDSALEHPAVESVVTIGRRGTGREHSRLTEVVHEDFSECSTLGPVLEGVTVALFCLGVYTGAVPDEDFRRITVDYAVEFGRAVRDASPDAAFCLLSGAGADLAEKSRVAFARYKGMAENALIWMDFPRLYLFRPGYIYPVEPRKEPGVGYRVLRAIWPVLGKLAPNSGIDSDVLGRTMLEVGLNGAPGHDGPVLENRVIRELGEECAC